MENLTLHLIELRKRLIWTIIGFLLFFLVLSPWANQLYQQLASPISRFLPSGSQLIATDITSPFFVPLKLTAIVAFVLSLPNSLYQIWQFISPGLYKKEQKLFASIIASAFCLFLCGICFCYFLVLPAIFHFINHFKSVEITMFTDINKYLDFVLSLFIIFGIAFEMPVIIFLLIYFGILTIKKAQEMRSYIFVACFILAAIVTPPDVLSQTMLALPLFLLYELGILAACLFRLN